MLPGEDPSTIPSRADDNDVASSSDSDTRIYFGPLQSPEKRFVKDPASLVETPTTERPSLSLPHFTFPAVPIDHSTTGPTLISGDEDGFAGVGTPMAEDYEEPTSALATKVLRAWDNPSPPPSPTPANVYPFDNDEVSNDSSESTTPPEQPLLQSTALLTAEHQSTPQDYAEHDIDLINFNSFSAPSNSPCKMSPVAKDEGISPKESAERRLATVDDLLTSSPAQLQQLPPVSTTHLTIPFHDRGEVSPSVEEEEQVLGVLADDHNDPTPSPVVGIPHIVDSLPTFTLNPPNNAPTTEPIPETSPPALRRSSRPRRSVTPLPVPLITVASPGKNTPNRKKVGSDTAGDSSPEIIVTRRKRSSKGKQRATSVDSSFTTNPAIVEGSEQVLAVEASRCDHERVLEPLMEEQLSSFQSHFPDPSPVSGPTTTESQNTHPSMNPLLKTPSKSVPELPIHHTPARRVPIAEAIAQGSFSPQKLGHPNLGSKASGSNLAVLGTPVFRRVALNDPNRTPARRIPISEALLQHHSPSKAALPGLGSPVRPVVHRSKSEEPQPIVTRKVNQRSSSLEPSSKSRVPNSGGLSQRFIPPSSPSVSGLPYPIRPVASRSTTTILEVDEETEQPPPDHLPSSSPPKQVSFLRQPSSKIPRIGSKPYARPVPSRQIMSSSSSSKPPGKKIGDSNIGALKINPLQPQPASQPMRTLRRATGKQPAVANEPTSSSDLDFSSQSSSKPVDNTTAEPATASTLKRKREEVARASPAGPKLVLIRQPPSVLNPTPNNRPAPSPAVSRRSPTKAKSPTPSKAGSSSGQGRLKMRRVVDVNKKTKLPQPTSSDDEKKASSISKENNSSEDIPMNISSPSPLLATSKVDIRSPSPQIDPIDLDTSIAHKPTRIVEPTTTSSSRSTRQSSTIQAEASTSLDTTSSRRSTRSKKTTTQTITTDIFGVISTMSTSTTSTARTRRKPPIAEHSVFFGMTALALRSLTTSNTTRNQQQIVEIQKEIIRKEGARPDSPTTKVRTALEKQKEEKVQQRQQRAERRARRSEGGVEVADLENEPAVDLEDSESNGRHRRGPGETEDYESPPRPERPIKRGRFEEEGSIQDEKRVKWDRGLATTVFLDDAPPNPRRPPKVTPAMKGCLSQAAKALRLDTMGNVLNADVPVPDIIRENVVVKKFVYDDDVELDLPPPPTPEPKTRSKSRKARS